MPVNENYNSDSDLIPKNSQTTECQDIIEKQKRSRSKSTVADFLTENCPNEISVSDFYVVCNGRKVCDEDILDEDKIYHIVPRLVGGKGGFGSMLRAIGAQIEKTTSREACRDLSGRRMRDINNEKKLKDWLAKEADREKEREERKAEKRQRELNKRHKFEDKTYHEQKEKVAEELEDALSQGLKKAQKREDLCGAGPSKKARLNKSSKKDWLGVDLDSDDLDSDSDMEALPVSTADDSTPDRDCHSHISPPTEPATSSTTCTATSSSDSPHRQDESSSKDLTKPTDEGDTNQTEPVSQVDPNTPVDLDLFSSSEDLEALGLERLKVALMTRGLKCGGTLTERASRLFCVKGLREEEIDPALKSKGKGKKKS